MVTNVSRNPNAPRLMAPLEPCLECVSGNPCPNAPQDTPLGTCDPIMAAFGMWARETLERGPKGYKPHLAKRRPR
jgi:hypothetical protein